MKKEQGIEAPKLKQNFNIEEFLGEGWFPIESNGIKKWVWSKKESYLNFPPEHKGLSLEFSGCPIEATDLFVYYGNNKMGYCKLTNALTVINIPSGISSCRIKVSNTWVPKEFLGTEDERILGVCLHSINSLKLYLKKCNWFPFTIEMGLTGVCNINPPCVMCVTRNSRYKKERSHLSQSIIDKMKPYCNFAKIVSLHGSQGEPLLSTKLLDIVNMIEKNVHTMFATNGLLLTREMSDRFISAGLREINVSIDAANPVTYHKIRNNNGFYTILDNIKNLVSLKKERQALLPQIIINMVLMKENLFELPNFIVLAHELEVPTVQIRLLVPLSENYEIKTDVFYFNYYEQRIDVGSRDFKRIINVSKEKAAQFGINIIGDNPEVIASLKDDSPSPKRLRDNKMEIEFYGDIIENGPLVIQQEPRCKYPWENFLIDINGDVRFCCHSSKILGNLNDDDFLEIWNSETSQSIRSSFLDNQLPESCLKCPLLLLQNQIWGKKQPRQEVKDAIIY